MLPEDISTREAILIGQAYEAKDEARCRRVAAHYTELFCACVNQVDSAGS